MSQANPYEPSTVLPAGDLSIQKVRVRPIDLFKRGRELIRGQYWTFLGITFVGIIIASMVPFGLIMGPMMVGIYLCYAAASRGERVEFGRLFKGFDHFKESFIAFLVLLAVTFVVMIPLMIAMFALVLMPMANAAQQAGPNGPPPEFPVAFLVMYPVMLVANLLVTIPFLFTFQLIADRNMTGIAAVKTSVAGVLKNLGGVIWYMIALMFITVLLAMMCYVPAFLFFPISFGSMFCLYRDIFPVPVGQSTQVEATV